MLAKEQLGTPQGGQDCILGLSWNKEAAAIEIRFPTERAPVTKRGIVGKSYLPTKGCVAHDADPHNADRQPPLPRQHVMPSYPLNSPTNG